MYERKTFRSFSVDAGGGNHCFAGQVTILARELEGIEHGNIRWMGIRTNVAEFSITGGRVIYVGVIGDLPQIVRRCFEKGAKVMLTVKSKPNTNY
jgi:hypothetical protein